MGAKIRLTLPRAPPRIWHHAHLGHLSAFPRLLVTLQAAASPAWPRHPKLKLVRTPGGWVMQVGRHHKIPFFPPTMRPPHHSAAGQFPPAAR